MRILVDYIDERVQEIGNMLRSLTVEPAINGNETVGRYCLEYLTTCSEIETAIEEMVKRFGDMTLRESVRRFGHIEGEVETGG